MRGQRGYSQIYSPSCLLPSVRVLVSGTSRSLCDGGWRGCTVFRKAQKASHCSVTSFDKYVNNVNTEMSLNSPHLLSSVMALLVDFIVEVVYESRRARGGESGGNSCPRLCHTVFHNL